MKPNADIAGLEGVREEGQHEAGQHEAGLEIKVPVWSIERTKANMQLGL